MLRQEEQYKYTNLLKEYSNVCEQNKQLLDILNELNKTIVQKLKNNNNEKKPIVTKKLSPRQTEIIEYAARGLTNGEIAEKLCVTPSCIKLQIHNIITKLNVNNRTKAVLIYLRDYKGIDFGEFLF